MSVDLAGWEGAEPASDEEAARVFDTLFERYIAAEERTPGGPGQAGAS